MASPSFKSTSSPRTSCAEQGVSSSCDDVSYSMIRRSRKVLPSAPFSRRISGLGASACAKNTPLSSVSAGIKVLGVYCCEEALSVHGRPMNSKVVDEAAKAVVKQEEESEPADAVRSDSRVTNQASEEERQTGTSCCDPSSGGGRLLRLRKTAGGAALNGIKRDRSPPSASPPAVVAAANNPKTNPAREEEASSPAAEEPPAVNNTTSGNNAIKPRVYFRLLVDRTLELTLPLDVLRKRYPQVLIDYLLSTASFI